MILSNIYNTILVAPLLNLLVLFYNFLGQDIGLAIIALTVLIRLILYPSFKHQLESQKKLSEIQPKLQEIKDKHKDDKEAQSRAMMDFYKQNKINPFGSCLPMLVQLVVLFAMYRVFLQGLNGETLTSLYAFVSNPGEINTISFGFLNLSESNLILAGITAVAQFFQGKMMAKMQPQQKKGATDTGSMMTSMMSKQFVYIFPVITLIIGAQLPSGLLVYWLITTLFAIGQQSIIMKGKSEKIINS
jgi:YidC/Oxa1 family membrane protein insertase